MRLGALLILLLTCCSALCADAIPTVIILAIGGTIASKRNPAKGGYEPGLTGEDLVQAVPAVLSIAHIQVEQISNISSSDMTPEIWLKLAGRIKDLLVKPEIAGIVVTHGTNTLEGDSLLLGSGNGREQTGHHSRGSAPSFSSRFRWSPESIGCHPGGDQPRSLQ